MRIHVLSDLHLEFGPIDLPKIEADLVVLAGDIHVKLNGIRCFTPRRVYRGAFPLALDSRPHPPFAGLPDWPDADFVQSSGLH